MLVYDPYRRLVAEDCLQIREVFGKVSGAAECSASGAAAGGGSGEFFFLLLLGTSFVRQNNAEFSRSYFCAEAN